LKSKLVLFAVASLLLVAAIYCSTATHYASAKQNTGCGPRMPLGKEGAWSQDCCSFEETDQGKLLGVKCYKMACNRIQDCAVAAPDQLLIK